MPSHRLDGAQGKLQFARIGQQGPERLVMQIQKPIIVRMNGAAGHGRSNPIAKKKTPFHAANYATFCKKLRLQKAFCLLECSKTSGQTLQSRRANIFLSTKGTFMKTLVAKPSSNGVGKAHEAPSKFLAPTYSAIL